MTVSQNGYPAGIRSVLYNPVVLGTSIDFPGGVRKGPTGQLLLYVALQLHRRVENGGDGYGMWGYAYRPIAGFRWSKAEDEKTMIAASLPADLLSGISGDPDNRCCAFDNEDTIKAASTLSNHSSGTAIDWKAPSHPLARRGTFSTTQVATIHQIVNVECQRAVRWGGDYSGRVDEMHFEIVQSEAVCQQVLNRLGSASAPPPTGKRVLSYTKGQPLMSGPDAAEVQRVLNAWYKTTKPVPDWYPLNADGVFGPATDAAVRYMQIRASIPSDGVVGPITRSVLHI